MPTDQLEIVGDRLQFFYENQGVWSGETVATGSDPAGLLELSRRCVEYPEFHDVCPTLSHFLTTFCLQNLVLGLKKLFSVETELESPTDLINGDLSDVWVYGFFVYGEPSRSIYHYYSRRIVMELRGYWLATNDEQVLTPVSDRHTKQRIH